jgi:hypothetical protein
MWHGHCSTVMAGLGPATHDLEADTVSIGSSVRLYISRYARLFAKSELIRTTGLLLCADGKSWVAGPSPAMTVKKWPR